MYKNVKSFKEWLILTEMPMQNSLPENVYIIINNQDPDSFTVYYSDAYGNRSKNPKGFLVAKKVNFNGAEFFRVKASESFPNHKGWGPLLYDIAMEEATERGSGLASDDLNDPGALFRPTVSPDAMKVWQYYHDKRPDVKKTLIPENEKIINFRKKRGKEKTWFSPLDYFYTKPTVMKKQVKVIEI